MRNASRAPSTTPCSSGALRPVDIPSLTGLRAFAAAVVVAHHLLLLIDGVARYPIGATRSLLEGGALGVDVFFVLSGFIIAHTYAHRLTDRAPGAVRDYLVARVARVYPLHLVTLLAFAAIVVSGLADNFDPDSGAHYSGFGFVANVLMLQALPGVYPWNYPSWSISCELLAYLLFPLFAARLLRLRWPVALTCAAAALGLQLLVMYAFSSTSYALHIAFWSRIAGEFTAGALLWVVWGRVLRPGRWGDAVTVLCALGSMWSLWRGYPWPICIPLLAAMIPASACATGAVRRILCHPITQWAGRTSYALYLVHALALAVALMVFLPHQSYFHHSASRTVLLLGAFLVVSLAAAALLHHGVEEPARRWVRRRFAGGPVDTGAEPVSASGDTSAVRSAATPERA